MRKQKTFHYWDQTIRFLNAIHEAFDVSSISIKWVKVFDRYKEKKVERCRVIVNYK